MSKCLNCGKELVQTPNKKKKKYCNSTCRSNKWQKDERKEAAKAAKTKKRSKKAVKAVGKKRNKSLETEAKLIETFVSIITQPKTLKELKALCPKELAGLERSAWISEHRKKYSI